MLFPYLPGNQIYLSSPIIHYSDVRGQIMPGKCLGADSCEGISIAMD